MYQYSELDNKIVYERVAQFRGQTARFLEGKLAPNEFLPLRLQNGLYMQRHAPMLRIAVPYGLLSTKQLRMLAHIAKTYDKNYGHFTTRQNIQFNWPHVEQVPDILACLASVEMHAIQTSGNCIRNITSDEFAGVTSDEIEDPRPYCEILRHWSTFHPEFAFLPRKFKIAVSACLHEDRAAVQVHDIGLYLIKNEQNEIGFQVLVGGGLGRTPLIGAVIKPFLEKQHLLTYLEAILRIYNRYGRRDNKYKARIKILVKALTPEIFAEQVEAEWLKIKDSPLTLTQEEMERVTQHFIPPNYEVISPQAQALATYFAEHTGFRHWYQRNTFSHKKSGYRICVLSLKATGNAPGDATGEEMIEIAQLADQYSFGEVRVTHHQNIVMADVKESDLFELWHKLKALGFATPNIRLLSDITCCPGGDFCSLANAKSIPIAEQIQRKFDDLDYLFDLGEIDLNISGCMNACGHHHVGNIGILGVDKKGKEYYQISVGGSGGNNGKDASIAEILGPSFEQQEVANIVQKILDVFIKNRIEGESFISTYRRIGIAPFKENAYA